MPWRGNLPNFFANLPELTNLLDVRENPGRAFVKGAAWIPLSQLKSRTSELAASHVPLSIAAVDENAETARSFLQAGGRVSTLSHDFCITEERQSFRLWRANSFLEETLPSLTKGIAVDLGCGAGREAVTLALSGMKVVAVDNLPDALERGRLFSSQYDLGEKIEWVCSDAYKLDEGWFKGISLVCSFFFFDRSILRRVIDQIPAGAKIVLEAFTEVHAARVGKPSPDRFAMVGELDSFDGRLRNLLYSEEWRESGRHTVRLLAEKI